MAKINLLPWREERRQQLKKEFLTTLVFVLLMGGIAVFLGNMFYQNKIAAQESRNQYIQRHITELDKQIAEIKDLNERREELLTRMEVIQNLQGNRPVIVRLFDEVVRTLPDGVFYQSLELAKTSLSMKGIAESNNRISSLMRRTDNSDWLTSPNLTSVKGDKKFGDQASEFSMSAQLDKPALDKDKKGGQ